MKHLLLLILFALICPISLQAGEGNPAFRSTNYPLPRFISLGKAKVYVRAGPGSRFPIKWEYQKKALPVEVVLEFEHWRKIKDFEGQEGWIHKTMLSGARTALVREGENAALYNKVGGRLIAKLEPRVIVSIRECTVEWCKISASGYKGWVDKKALWGVYAKEIVE